MADAPQGPTPLDPNIAANLKMAEAFYDAALKGTNQSQKEKDALISISEIYDKLAKQQADILATKNDIAELDEKAKKLMKDREKATDLQKKAIEKELVNLREITAEKTKHRKESEKELETTKKQVSELAKQKNVFGDMFTSMKAKVLTAVVSVEALRRGLSTLLQTSRDIADISILSGKYTGMQGEGVGNAVSMIADYATQVSKAQVTLAAFGYTAEEARGAFKEFAQLSSDTKQIEQMTAASGALSRMLGVDLSESTGFIIEQNLRFNKTAAQSAQTLYGVQQSVEGLNKGMDKSIIRGRDVTKVLFDISRESKALAQDQDAIAKMLIGNVLQLQKGGVSYKEAFDTSKKFAEILTKDAPEFMQILGGRRIFGELNKNKDAMLNELKKSSPEVAQRVEDIMKQVQNKKISQYAAERMVNELVGQTKVGLKASMQQFAETMNIGASGAIERVMASYGVTFTQARQMIDSAKKSLDLDSIVDELDDKSKTPIELKTDVKAKLGLDISDKDVEALKFMGKDQRENAIQSMVDEKAKGEIQNKQAQEQINKQRQIKDLGDEYNRLKKQADLTGNDLLQTQAAEVKKQLDALQKGPEVMGQIAEALQDKLLQVDFKGYAESILAWFKNPVAQIAAGLTSLALLGAWSIASLAEAHIQTVLLAKIAGVPSAGMMKSVLGAAASSGAMGLLMAAGIAAAGAFVLYEGYQLYNALQAKSANDAEEKVRRQQGKEIQSLERNKINAAQAGGDTKKADFLKRSMAKHAMESVKAQTSELAENGIPINDSIKKGALEKLGYGPEDIADIIKYSSAAGSGPVDVGGMGPVAPPPVPGQVGGGASTGGQMTQRAELVQGAQGTDIMLMTRIPIAQATAQNMSLRDKMGTSATGH